MPLTKADLVDVDIIDAYELKSDGRATTPVSIYQTTVGISTTSGTQTVVSNPPADGEGFLTGRDHPVEVGDFLVIVGSLPGGIADGAYTVASVVDDVTVTVVQPIATSTGGAYTWVYPAGASKVGFDPTGQTITAANGLQQAVTDIANAVTGGGITEPQHQLLRTLVHEIDANSYDVVTRVNDRVMQIVTWDSPAMLLKIREVNVTRDTIGRVITHQAKQYDIFGALKETLTETVARTSCGRIATINRVRVP